MRTTHLRALVLLLTFAIGVGLAGLTKNRKAMSTGRPCARVPTPEDALTPCAGADYSLLQQVTHCDLMATPEAYENKWVLIGYYYRPGALREKDYCTKGDPQFRVQVVPLDEVAARQEGWDKSLFINGKTLTLIGKFRRRYSSSSDPAKQSQFELLAAHGVITDGFID